MNIDVSLDALTINGHLFTEGVPLDSYISIESIVDLHSRLSGSSPDGTVP